MNGHVDMDVDNGNEDADSEPEIETRFGELPFCYFVLGLCKVLKWFV
jgi:hypothetical protein